MFASTVLVTLGRRKQWLLPSGVEEAVPGEAVSGRGRRSEPESRSTASVKLPLKSVVTGTEAQGGLKQTVLLLGRLIIYLMQPIQLSWLKRNPAPVSGAPQRMLEVFQARQKEKKKFLPCRQFDVLCIRASEAEKRRWACLRSRNYTLAKSKRSLMFFSSWSGGSAVSDGGDFFFFFFFLNRKLLRS